MKRKFDVIIVGLGTMGAAAAHHLSRRGVRVLGLEKFDIPHANGAGHGYSRMIRTAYHEHPDYIPLLRSAFTLWHQLESESGQKIIHITGGLYMGELHCGLPGNAAVAARKYGVPFELLDRSALARRYPQFQVPENYAGLYEPNAGFVVPESAIAAHALLALRDGAELHGQEAVISWAEEGDGVSVKTDRDHYWADQVLFCGGAWTDKLVKNLGVELAVTRQVLGWVWPKRPELFEIGRFPVWAIDTPDHRGEHYGFPMMPSNPGFKVAYHSPGTPTDPERVLRQPLPGDEETFRPILNNFIPEADGPLLSLRTCLYTYSPDRHFIIDRHPGYSRVTLACGFSGHGFKFASVVGQALGELVEFGRSKLPIEFLGLSRFNPTARDR